MQYFLDEFLKNRIHSRLAGFGVLYFVVGMKYMTMNRQLRAQNIKHETRNTKYKTHAQK
jgi:hypothetical protein